jgi:DNA-3-methyladenine glycosylase I
MTTRCSWADTNELLRVYHDQQWGVPVHDDRLLFEMLNLEGAQAGLSWLTVLKRLDSYRIAFNNFDARKIVAYDEQKQIALLADPGIIRNRLKVQAVIENAKTYLNIRSKAGDFDAYIWSFSSGKTLDRTDHNEAVPVSEQMSKDLKKKGFRFVGPTICYAYMQAVGIMNDHEPECFRYDEVKSLLQKLSHCL